MTCDLSPKLFSTTLKLHVVCIVIYFGRHDTCTNTKNENETHIERFI